MKADSLEQQIQAFINNDAELNDTGRLHQLLDIMWEWRMTQFPEFATYVGYPGQNHRWTDNSLDAIAQRHEAQKQFLEAMQNIDPDIPCETDQLDYELIRKKIERGIEGFRFKSEYIPITQMGGVQQNVPHLLSIMPAATVEDYENILSRLNGVQERVNQTIALMNKGLESGITPPRITLRDVPQQAKNVIVDEPMDSPMLAAFKKFPDAIPSATQERLCQEASKLLTGSVYPAFNKLHDYLVDTYIPQARETISAADLPDGDDWYAYTVRRYTTTDLTPQEIHKIGLAEVERIRGEMERIISDSGFEGTFAEFAEFLRTDPQFFFGTAEELLMAYRDISKRIDPELTKLFGVLPRLPYGVKPIPSHAEKSQTTAYYQPGSLKANRPGYFFANTYDLKSRPKWEMEALTLHEAVPGHHLQLALVQELEEAHDLRKYDSYTVYVEGWALYAESLGETMGFYQDPYSKFGQLTYEMWRSIRLVVDTGIHAHGWSRQQAIDFFKQHTAKAMHDIVVEVDRYIVWPGQALAYKMGELKIKELRIYAEEELGERFDARSFHDALLGNGSLPLDVLETRMKKWVGEQ